jgi:RNA polymerase sigma factor (sigma-70 family)
MKSDATLQELIESWAALRSGGRGQSEPADERPDLSDPDQPDPDQPDPDQPDPDQPDSDQPDPDQIDADRVEKIIVEVAAPIVRRTIRYRLHFYINERGASPANPDAEDLYHDILARLIAALRRLATGKSGPAIADFGQYTQRVAINGCNDYLRMKYPQRTRLRDRLRDLLERQPEFGIWRGGEGEMLCGLAEWRDGGVMRADPFRLTAAEAEPVVNNGLTGSVIRGTALVELIGGIFRFLEGPILLEALVATVAARLGVTEYRCESLDSEADGAVGAGARPRAARLSSDNRLPAGRGGSDWSAEVWMGWMGENRRGENRREDGAVGLERHIDERIALRRMWEVWLTLPPRPRETFFYSFSTSRGEDLLTLLFEAGVTAPSEVAGVLGLSLEELVGHWKRMPMRNVELAAMWGVPRQQVNKWRFQALRMIEKRLV